VYVVALHQAIPFVGFGIMDNAILILAGGHRCLPWGSVGIVHHVRAGPVSLDDLAKRKLILQQLHDAVWVHCGKYVPSPAIG
jgi:hypothetical protein